MVVGKASSCFIFLGSFDLYAVLGMVFILFPTHSKKCTWTSFNVHHFRWRENDLSAHEGDVTYVLHKNKRTEDISPLAKNIPTFQESYSQKITIISG